MNNSKSIPTSIEEIVKICDEKKAADIKLYDISGRSILTEYFLLISVSNKIHIQSMIEEISKKIFQLSKKKKDILEWPLKVSGSPESEWVIVDANAIIIHIMTPLLRDYYQLDKILETKSVVYHY